MSSTSGTMTGGLLHRGSAGSPWIHSRGFDLVFLTLSAILVFLPYLSYGLLQRVGLSVATASLAVGLSVTVLVGGPHMYSTYLRTALEPGFRKRWRALAYAPLVVIPTLVILGSLFAFPVLLTFFFFWASIHIAHQAVYISESYRRKSKATVTWTDRILDYAVILGALYTIAMYKFVESRFIIGSQPLLFPNFLKLNQIAVAFSVGFAGLLAYYIVRTVSEIRRGQANYPRILFMSLTVAMAFIVPAFDNLDVSFQGFNTWHSFQYLALTWFILRQKAERGEIGTDFVRGLARPGRTWRFYGVNILLTLSAGAIYLALWKGLGFPQDQCYYVVVLSFLLVHYFYDHLLFTDFDAFEPITSRQLERSRSEP
jgi:hypothetical protein